MTSQASDIPISAKVSAGREKLRRIKRLKWPAEGRDHRVAEARAIWEAAAPPIALDRETLRYIAEAPDLEEDSH